MLFEPVYPRCRRGPEILTLFGFRLLVRKRPLLLLCAGTRRHFNSGTGAIDLGRFALARSCCALLWLRLRLCIWLLPLPCPP